MLVAGQLNYYFLGRDFRPIYVPLQPRINYETVTQDFIISTTTSSTTDKSTDQQLNILKQGKTIFIGI